MSKIEVDKIDPQSGTNLELGSSGDTITVPTGVTLDASNATTTLPANVVTTDGTQTLTNKTINGSQIVDTSVSVNKLSATGTKDATTFLRGDNSFAEVSGGVSYDTSIKTADFTAVANTAYFVDTTSNVVTVTLPASPTVGDQVEIKDYAANSETNKIILNPNSLKILSSTDDRIIFSNGSTVRLVYSGTTNGWLPSLYASNQDATSADFYNIEYFAIGGGGAGGCDDGGGGGSGGYRNGYYPAPPGGTLTVTIGSGAGGGSSAPTTGQNTTIVGTQMTGFEYTVTALGGGSGGGEQGQQGGANNGGSGGGFGSGSATGNGASAIQTEFSLDFSSVLNANGKYGGNNGGGVTGGGSAGGGGGIGQVGGTVGGNNSGNGGNGLQFDYTGSQVYYGGGGGGNGRGGTGTGGQGGGANEYGTGSANTGGGGGGSGDQQTANGGGGSGIVFLKMLTTNYSGTTTGSPTVTTSGDYTILKYTGSGSYTT